MCKSNFYHHINQVEIIKKFIGVLSVVFLTSSIFFSSLAQVPPKTIPCINGNFYVIRSFHPGNGTTSEGGYGIYNYNMNSGVLSPYLIDGAIDPSSPSLKFLAYNPINKCLYTSYSDRTSSTLVMIRGDGSMVKTPMPREVGYNITGGDFDGYGNLYVKVNFENPQNYNDRRICKIYLSPTSGLPLYTRTYRVIETGINFEAYPFELLKGDMVVSKDGTKVYAISNKGKFVTYSINGDNAVGSSKYINGLVAFLGNYTGRHYDLFKTDDQEIYVLQNFDSQIIAFDPTLERPVARKLPNPFPDRSLYVWGEAACFSPEPTVTLTGRIWDDANASATEINEKHTVPGYVTDALKVYLTDSFGQILGKGDVLYDGTWIMRFVPTDRNYKVTLSNDPIYQVGDVATNLSAVLPSTGEWIQTGVNTPGLVLGDPTRFFLDVERTNLTEINFGIQKRPEAYNQNFILSETPHPGESMKLNGKWRSTPSPAALSGNDFEDGIFNGSPFDGGPVTHVRITSLPVPIDGTASEGVPELYYNKQRVVAGETILNYYDELLEVKLNGKGYKGFSFTYQFTDAANTASDPATYQVTWPSPLPVKLLSFDVLKENNAAMIIWSTSEEENADRFEVERSNDANNWSRIGSVDAKGESQTLEKYEFADSLLPDNNNYYRLKMIDQDGSYAYSRVKYLSVDHRSQVSAAYPNPVSKILFLQGLDKTTVKNVSIVNMQGAKVYNSDTISSSGINVGNWASGLYLLRITRSDGLSTTQRIVIAN